LNSRYAIVAAVVVIAILGVGIFILATPGGRTSSSSSQSAGSSPFSSSSSTSSSASGRGETSNSSSSLGSSTSSASTGYYLLVFTQKGIAELTSTDGTLLGYSRLYNISDSVPTQTFYWEGYPLAGAAKSNFLVPLNNGTIEVVNSTLMKVTGRISVGTATGFIGVSISADQQYAAIADGPSGVVEVVKLATVQTVWKAVFDQPSGQTAFPCDVRWSPDQSTILVPMRYNGTVDVIGATTGRIVAGASLPIATQPFMLSVNSQGSQLAVELSGNKSVVFFSYPALTPLGRTSFNSSTFSPTRGVFTPDGKHYLEASGSTNVVSVISTSTFAVVNTIDLPTSSAPGLADMELAPGGLDAYVVMHGTPATGGIIYLISLADATTATGAASSIPLTTAPAFAVPVSIQFGTYLADNVLSPPITGLHC
jgi:hypothetical protein